MNIPKYNIFISNYFYNSIEFSENITILIIKYVYFIKNW